MSVGLEIVREFNRKHREHYLLRKLAYLENKWDMLVEKMYKAYMRDR